MPCAGTAKRWAWLLYAAAVAYRWRAQLKCCKTVCILSVSGRRRGHPRRPPTPPDMRFRIRRFMKRTGAVVLSPLSSASGASCPPQRRSEPRRGSAPSPLCRSFLTGSLLLSWALHVIPMPTCGVSCSALQPRLAPTMASADFRQSIPRPLDRGSTNRQTAGSPRV